MIRVLYVGSGFCSAKGLAGELPEYLLNHRSDITIDVAVPHSQNIDEGAGRLAERLVECNARVDGQDYQVKVLEGRLEGHVRAFYMDNDCLRDGLDLSNDDGIRACAVFAHAVCAWLEQSPQAYDIVHCDGLLTALIPTFMRCLHADSKRIRNTKALVFLPGVENKAIADMSWISRMGLPEEMGSSEGMEFYGRISILKGAYLYADALAFPSDYIRTAIEKNRGRDIGMEGVLFDRTDRIHTLSIGACSKVPGPARDKAIAAAFSAEDMNGKARCKTELAQRLRLKKNRPMITFIGELDSESGFDMVNDILDDLMDRQANLVILGQGNDAYRSAVEGWQNEFRGSVAWINEKPSCESVRRVLSGSDILLLPAKHDNISRLHQIAMMYGCVVVARRLGCVAHDVQGVHFLEILGRHEDSGGYIKIGPDDNGFIFERYDCDEFFNSAMDALDVYESAGWNEVRSHAMRESFSFEQTANDCMKIYEALKG